MTNTNQILAGVFAKMGLKETAIATKVFTYGDVKMLDKSSSVKLSVKEQNALKKLIEVGSFKVTEGQWGSRCKMSYILGERKFSGFCNIYHEDYDRDFPEGDISDEDKKKLVVVFYEKPNDFRFTVYMMDDIVTSIDDVITKLGLD